MTSLARSFARRRLSEETRRRLLNSHWVPERILRSFGVTVAVSRPTKADDNHGTQPQGALLATQLRRGVRLNEAVTAEIRALLKAHQVSDAQSIATGLTRTEETRVLGNLCIGIIAQSGGHSELAWSVFREVPTHLWSELAPSEFVRSGLAQDPRRVLDQIRELVTASDVRLSPSQWWEMLKPVYGIGEGELATRLYAKMTESEQKTARRNKYRDWIDRWIDREPDAPSAPAAEQGHVSFAVADYDHPDRSGASRNIGDHVQTIASLGHIVRHKNVSFRGEQDLVELLEHLRARVRPEFVSDRPTVPVQITTVDRDASNYNEIPPNTWTLAFGWFMHPIYKMRFDFPMHKNLLPIFVSFHCNKRELLTDSAIEYLKRFGPVGCRDWTTVDILLSAGVPAFFSGCLTTTVNTTFPDTGQEPPTGAPVLYSDVPATVVPDGAKIYKHTRDKIRDTRFTTNVYDAIKMLESFRRDYSSIVTSRLHCYLPSRSLGIPVDFQPKNRSDIRFAGLIDITDDEFNAIRDGISAKLERVTAAIFSGSTSEDVYDLWRDLTADDVKHAEQRRDRAEPLPAPGASVRKEADKARQEAKTFGASSGHGRDVDIAIWVQPGRERALEVLADSIVQHSARPTHLHLISTHDLTTQADSLVQLHDNLVVTTVRTDNIGRTPWLVNGEQPSERTIARLLLPELLPNVDRVVQLPVDALVTADLAELADLDLGGQAIAAATVAGQANSGFDVVYKASTRLRARTKPATELRRRMHASHAFDFDSFNIDVMVLELNVLRDEGFVDKALSLLSAFGLNDREVYTFLFGPSRAVLEPRWATIPTRMPMVSETGLVHWADAVKPWDEWAAPYDEMWKTQELHLQGAKRG